MGEEFAPIPPGGGRGKGEVTHHALLGRLMSGKNSIGRVCGAKLTMRCGKCAVFHARYVAILLGIPLTLERFKVAVSMMHHHQVNLLVDSSIPMAACGSSSWTTFILNLWWHVHMRGTTHHKLLFLVFIKGNSTGFCGMSNTGPYMIGLHAATAAWWETLWAFLFFLCVRWSMVRGWTLKWTDCCESWFV